MTLPNPPELRRLAAFMDTLPSCPRGCPNGSVCLSPTFRVPTPSDTIDDQVTEIITQYEREAAGQLQRHLAEDHRDIGGFLALFDEASRKARRREGAYTAWLEVAGPAVWAELTACAELTAELIPADMDGARMSGWDAVDDALMYGVGNPPDPWCSDATCAHGGVRHKHTRLFRKPCVMAEDGTILEVER